MDISGINWLAIVVCVILNFVNGFIWYSPAVFYEPWWKGIGKSENEQTDPSPVLYAWTTVAAVVEAVFVSMLINTMGSITLVSGLTAGFMIWVGFVATTNLVNNLFAGRGFRVWAIEAGNHLVYLLICGSVLSVWR
jgi:hypothetical protein